MGLDAIEPVHTLSTVPLQRILQHEKNKEHKVSSINKVVIKVEEVTNNVYEHGNKDDTMFAYEDMKITVNDYERVMQRQNSWLNHAVIDYYMKILDSTVHKQRLIGEKKEFCFNISFILCLQQMIMDMTMIR